MFKKLFCVVFIMALLTSYASAWEMENYTNVPADTIEIEQKKAQNFEQNNREALKRHSLSVEYNWITLTDLAFAVASIFEDDTESFGAISVDYGYTFAEIFETGLVFNYALTNRPVVSFMPKIRFNGNLGGIVNPFMEMDIGVGHSAYTNKWFPIGHITLLGLEIGYPVSLRFQIPFLLWGQRGIAYMGLGFRF